MTGEHNSPSTLPRRTGFLRAMEKHGLPVDDDLLFAVGYYREAGSDGMERLMTMAKPPTAVFCGGDGIAVGAYDYCIKAGLKIGEDVSIVGFDNAPFLSHISPGLTTVHHPLVQIGATATTLILNRIDVEASGRPYQAETVTMDTELIIRESTGRPNR
jgi:DNA-binding LacI/PurR family transcriptional regulator